MLSIRRSSERGHFNFGWLDTSHTFSFGEYHDPQFMGFRNLRVINEDRISPNKGFGTHSHRDMEIISYVVDGELAHKDSMGNGSSILPGEVQYMSAGSGVTHSEYNFSKEQTTHFFQIWILPNQTGGEPRYRQKTVPLARRKNNLYKVIGPDGSGSIIEIRQDVSMYMASLDADVKVDFTLQKDRYAWIQMVHGELDVNGQNLLPGDGCAISEVAMVAMKAKKASEFLFFDLN